MTQLMTTCGLDEAGRGALAGPLVLAAIVLPTRFRFEEVAPSLVIRDSKLLTARQRLALHDVIKEQAIEIATEVISVGEINGKGINWGNIEGFRRMIGRVPASRYVVDGRWALGDLGERSELVACQIRADQTVPATLAAGIVAKVVRDTIMDELDCWYPMYGWSRNTGHGTPEHVAAIREFGVTEHHRTQFVSTALRPRRAKQAPVESRR